MDYIEISPERFKKFSYINRGTEGEVRRYNEEYVIKKVYASSRRFINVNLETMKKQHDLPTKYFVTPTNLVEYDYNLVGYIMPYINGENGENVFFTDLLEFLEISKKIIEESKLFTENRILIDDIQLKNTIYKGYGELYIIDTLRYVIVNDYTIEGIRKRNIVQLNQLFIDALFGDVFIWRRILDDPNLKTTNNLQDPYKTVIPFYQFLEEIINYTDITNAYDLGQYYSRKRRIRK